MRAIVLFDDESYSYAGMGYANPHAVSQIANGQSTTTYSYDQNGNLTQKTTDGVTTTYLWDYANRLIALGSGGATTTYGYDAFGSRVFQSTATSTTIYPFKWYSVASSTGTGATYATTTEYLFNGDTLVSTIDQQFASGAATGTAQTRYIHPDHLGSTNVVTNASGTAVQTLDYYPYGAMRINMSVGGADSQRKYINRFFDPGTGLSYLQALYYDTSRGQFLTQDPTFWSGRQNLTNPQSLNSYSYADGNPINQTDPMGLSARTALSGLLSQLASSLQGLLYQISEPQFVQQYHAAQTAVSIAQNPGAAASAAWNAGRAYVSDAAKAFKTIGRSDSGDYLLGQRAADILPFLIIKRPVDAAAIVDDALVVRGGVAAQSAARIDGQIAKSVAKGYDGFSVQCTNACTEMGQLGELGQYLQNKQLSVTTAAQICAAGGDVISTPGKGFHATVINLSGEAASNLPWWVYSNPNPLR
jgi:RHS repeat-associated protein